MKTFDDLIALSGRKSVRRLPAGWYDKDGDCIFYFAEDCEYTAEWVDEWVTVYKRESDGEIIGALIKWVSRLFKAPLMSEARRIGPVPMAPLLTVTYNFATADVMPLAPQPKPRRGFLRWLSGEPTPPEPAHPAVVLPDPAKRLFNYSRLLDVLNRRAASVEMREMETSSVS